jgi:hypothetical protein
MTRLRDLHRRLSAVDGGFVIPVGHGQFFRAYLLSRGASFAGTAERMKDYRAAETAQPIANCEVIELDGVTSG